MAVRMSLVIQARKDVFRYKVISCPSDIGHNKRTKQVDIKIMLHRNCENVLNQSIRFNFMSLTDIIESWLYNVTH